MKMKLFPILLLYIFATQLQAQTIIYPIYSGPSFKSVDYSANIVGTDWNLVSYNDVNWNYSYNGSGRQNGSTQCAGPNQSGWASNDTIIWSSPLTSAPDTACFRKIIILPKCGTVTAANFAPGADDYYYFYINGHFLGTNPIDGSGVPVTLNPQQLLWFNGGANVLAAEVINTMPSCGEFTLVGSITVDTTGCPNSADTTNRNIEISETKIAISPNPATSQVQLRISGKNSPFLINIYDEVGKSLFSAKSDNNLSTIDILSLSMGIYTIEVIDINGQSVKQKIAKQ